jgi:hypothetical protein
MHPIRSIILDRLKEAALTAHAPPYKRRLFLMELDAILPPDKSKNRNRNLRLMLNRILKNPHETRGGKRPGAGAPPNNQNARKEKHT